MLVYGCLEGPEERILGNCELFDLGTGLQPQGLLVEQQTLSTNELSLSLSSPTTGQLKLFNSEEQRREVSSVWPHWVEDQRDPMTHTHAPKYITRVLMRFRFKQRVRGMHN